MSKRQKRQIIDLPINLSKLHSTWLIVIFYPKCKERALTLPCMFWRKTSTRTCANVWPRKRNALTCANVWKYSINASVALIVIKRRSKSIQNPDQMWDLCAVTLFICVSCFVCLINNTLIQWAIGKNAQISCFVCLTNNTLIKWAIRKNAQITITSFYIQTTRCGCWVLTKCMLGPDEMHSCLLVGLKISEFCYYIN